MDEAHPFSILMVLRSVDVNKDSFIPQKRDEQILSSQVPHLSTIGALMYIANTKRSDIAFVVNLLGRYSSASTKRHWMGSNTYCDILKGQLIWDLFEKL